MLTRNNIRSIYGSLLAVAFTCLSAAAHSAVPSTANNVAGWVGKATKIGTAAGDQAVTIAVHLALTNPASLKQLVAEVSSPTSRQYGRYITPEEFGRRFGPAASDVRAVEALLRHAGMTEIAVGPHGMYVSAKATVNQLRTAFGVSQDLYAYKGMTLRANPEQPRLPAALAEKIVYVEGLDDSTLLRQPQHRSATMGPLVAPGVASAASANPGAIGPEAAPESAASKPAVTPPPVAAGNPSPYCNSHFGAGALVATLSTAAGDYGAAIPWLNCGYTPQQIRAAYGLNKVTKYDGAGVTVAIIDAYASPTLLADGNRYAANHTLPKLAPGKNFTQNIPLGIYDVSPSEACGPYGWWLEQSLDLASVHGAAPGAKILYIGSRDCQTSLDIALLNALYNHEADIATNSWTFGGEAVPAGYVSMFDQALLAGAAQGMTVLFSSGDDGDLSALNGVASGSWPATSAYVTGVGGTSLLLKDAGGAKSEYGWGNYRDLLADATVKSAKSVTTSGLTTTTAFGETFDAFAFYAGSGGGISLLEPQPSYQATAVPLALATTLNLASGFSEPLPLPQRVSPDVAMDADPYTGYLFGETFTIAGDAISDHGCKPISKTEEYCENAEGGTSLASPLMAGVIAVMNQKRIATGEPLVGFANPLLYSYGSGGNGVNLTSAGLNQIVAPPHPVSVLRGYAANLNLARVVTFASVPLLITTAPYALEVCDLPICLGIDDVFNFTSLSRSPYDGLTPAGYNDVTGLGVPYVPKLIQEE
jgi:subtilase family serine protease